MAGVGLRCRGCTNVLLLEPNDAEAEAVRALLLDISMEIGILCESTRLYSLDHCLEIEGDFHLALVCTSFLDEPGGHTRSLISKRCPLFAMCAQANLASFVQAKPPEVSAVLVKPLARAEMTPPLKRYARIFDKEHVESEDYLRKLRAAFALQGPTSSARPILLAGPGQRATPEGSGLVASTLEPDSPLYKGGPGSASHDPKRRGSGSGLHDMQELLRRVSLKHETMVQKRADGEPSDDAPGDPPAGGSS